MSIKVNQQHPSQVSSINNPTNLTLESQLALAGDYTDIYWNQEGFTVAQVNLWGSGLISASVDIEVSLDGIGFSKLQTIALPAGNDYVTVGAELVSATWPFIRAKLAAISGTVTKIQVLVRDYNFGS